MTDPVPPQKPAGTTRREIKRSTPEPEAPGLKKAPGQTTIRTKGAAAKAVTAPAVKEPTGVIRKEPSSPAIREATGIHRKEPSNTHIVQERTGSSARIRVPASPPTRALHRPTASTEAPDAARQRRRVDSALKGMSMRLKIMLSMAAVTLISAALIFVVVFNKTSKAMDDEINSRGERILQVLSSIDASYWRAAIHPTNRINMFEELLGALGEPVDKLTEVRSRPENQKLYDLLVIPATTTHRSAEMDKLVTQLTRNKEWKEKIQSVPWMLDTYTALVNPVLGTKYSPFENLKDMSKDLVNIVVYDLAKDRSNPRGIALGGDTVMGTVGFPAAETAEHFRTDTTSKVENVSTNVRLFVHNSLGPEGKQLRYVVSLSLKSIESTKGALGTLILLPILLSVAIALVIAWAVAQRITQPVKVLIEDINEVSSGNLEHQTHAHSSDEVGVLADTFNRMTVALRAAREQELEAKAMEHELGIAAEIQANLVPKKMLKVPGYEVNAYYRPSKEVGGDYYDFIEIDPTHSGIIVADVSGKGVPGSLVMSMTRAFIRMEAERGHNTSTAATMVSTNKMLAQDIKKGMFVTAIYAILDHATNKICVSSAGHNPMIIWRAASNLIELVNPKGIALGFDRGPVFERTITEEHIQLEKGDRVVMYTDGSVEAMNAKNEEFGDEPFFDLCRKNATLDSAQFLNLLMKALDDHKGDAPQHDDLTIVTFRFLP